MTARMSRWRLGSGCRSSPLTGSWPRHPASRARSRSTDDVRGNPDRVRRQRHDRRVRETRAGLCHIIWHMRTTLDLDDGLVEALTSRHPGLSRTEAIERAIRTYLEGEA